MKIGTRVIFKKHKDYLLAFKGPCLIIFEKKLKFLNNKIYK